MQRKSPPCKLPKEYRWLRKGEIIRKGDRPYWEAFKNIGRLYKEEIGNRADRFDIARKK